MIRVRKPADPPAVLLDKGSASTLALCRLVENDGGKELEFDKEIYGAQEVKQALSRAQHDKCCFCESKISHVAFGDVEHFRPKAACRASSDAPERKPGYYWEVIPWREISPATTASDLLDQLEDDAIAARWLAIPPY